MPAPSETWQNDWQTGFSSWPSIPANRPPPPQRSVLLTSSFRRAPAAVAFALPSTRFQLRKTSAPPTFQFSQTRCKSETSAPLQQVPRNQHHVILPHATLRNRCMGCQSSSVLQGYCAIITSALSGAGKL